MIHYLADTNILGYFVRRPPPPLQQRMALALQRREIAISTVTRAETRLGLSLMDPSDKRIRSINALLDEIPALAWTSEAADRYGEIAAYLLKVGQKIGEMDTMIAAHALVVGLPLVTHNTRHFTRVPRLILEDWTT